jgi:hypothetical protein
VIDFTTTGRETMSFPLALDELKKVREILSNNKETIKLVGGDTRIPNHKQINRWI